MSDLVFKPFININVMIIFSVIMLIIVLLNRKHIINRILMILVLLIVSQRPMIIHDNEEPVQYDSRMLDIYFVIDRTISMNAIDVNNSTRLEAVKKDCLKIMNSFPDAHYLLMIFDSYPRIVYPLTVETDIIKDKIKDLTVVYPNSFPIFAFNAFPTLKAPFIELKSALSFPKREEKVQKIVFFMSDGEVNSNTKEDNDLSSYKEIAPLIDDGMVLGYGTTKGAKMKLEDSYINDGQSISKINEDNLKKLASNMQVDYLHRINNKTIDSKINDITKNLEVKEDENQDTEIIIDTKVDIYHYFSGLLLLLMLFELLYYRRNEL